MNNRDLLLTTLELAVPLWFIEFQENSELYKKQEDRFYSTVDIITTQGDILLFKSSRKGESAKVFNELAFAIAWAAFYIPNGIHFLGKHWIK